MSEPSMRLPSLLESVGVSAEAAAATPAAPVEPFMRRPIRLSDRGWKWVGVVVAAAGVLSGAAMAWDAYRPISAPDAGKDPLRKVLRFALLDADFSRLPVEERLRLMLDLAKRLQSMSAGDSALMAAFAAGISGEARKQLEENIRRLGIDLMASYGAKYASVSEAEREQFLESTAVEWNKMMDQVMGRERTLTDAERLQEMRDQSKRDAERGRRTDSPLTPERAGNLARWVQNDIAQNTAANQRAQTSVFIRDMTRVLRGRDPDTNQPKRN